MRGPRLLLRPHQPLPPPPHSQGILTAQHPPSSRHPRRKLVCSLLSLAPHVSLSLSHAPALLRAPPPLSLALCATLSLAPLPHRRPNVR
eukprot:171691-Rhodomonas_salina.1